MGRISGPYGVKGWARVNAYTAQPNNLASYPTWYLSEKKVHREVAVEQTRVNGDVLFAKLTGLENREEIAKFRGADILVDLGSMPVLASNEYYWHELKVVWWKTKRVSASELLVIYSKLVRNQQWWLPALVRKD